MEVVTGQPFFFPGGQQGVVLLHSYTSSSADVRLLGRDLQRAGYSVYAPVFSGHGEDPLTVLQAGSPGQWWNDTQVAIRKLRDNGIRQVAVFGLSLGGLLATKALENDPTLAGGGVFASPVTTWGQSNVPRFFPKLATKFYQQAGLGSAEIQNKINQINALLPQQLNAIQAMAKDIAENLGDIHGSFFIGQGGQDEMIDPQSGQQLQQALVEHGVTVDYHYYPTASHVLTVNSARRQLAVDVHQYLNHIFEVGNDN